MEGNYRFSKDHVWVKPKEAGVFLVGITDFAQEQLGEILFVELPVIGKTLKAGEVLSIVESVKSASEVYMPVTGKVLEVNLELNDSPEFLNQEPFSEGYIAVIEATNSDDLTLLMDQKTYLDFISRL